MKKLQEKILAEASKKAPTGLSANPKWRKAIEDLMKMQIKLIKAGSMHKPLTKSAMLRLLQDDADLGFTAKDSAFRRWLSSDLRELYTELHKTNEQ